MADGDILHIKELGRFTIPGGGQSLSGVPKNNKIVAWGEIRGTYVSTGLDLAAEGGITAFGVTTLDYISFSPKQWGTAGSEVYQDAEKFGTAVLDKIENLIFMLEDVGAANAAAPTDSDDVYIDYVVIGDSAAAPDLT